jgi:ankyrin repeat protein
MRIKLFEEFGEWDRDVFLLDLFTMTSTEVEELFFGELRSKTPHIEKIKVILESGLVDVNIKSKDEYGWTPLDWACERDNLEIAKLLIDRGADVDAKDMYERTPLHFASNWNRIEIAKLLIEAGADVKVKDNGGRTPLHLAQSDKMRALLGGGL